MSRASARLARTAPGFELAPRGARPEARTIEMVYANWPRQGYAEQYSGGPASYLPDLVVNTEKLAERCYVGPPGPTQRERSLLFSYGTTLHRGPEPRISGQPLRPDPARPPAFYLQYRWQESYARRSQAELEFRQHREPTPDRPFTFDTLDTSLQQLLYSFGVMSRRIMAFAASVEINWTPRLPTAAPVAWISREGSFEVWFGAGLEPEPTADQVRVQVERTAEHWADPRYAESTYDHEMYGTGKGDPLAEVYGSFERTMSAIDAVLEEQ